MTCFRIPSSSPLCLAACIGQAPASSNASTRANVTANLGTKERVIQNCELGLDGVKMGPMLKAGLEPSTPGTGHTLAVNYEATSDVGPLRDVWSTPRSRNWSSAKAIRFRIRPGNTMELSVSFIDKNGLGFTQRTGPLKTAEWQTVMLSFDKFWFNRYAQPDKADPAGLERCFRLRICTSVRRERPIRD